MVACCLKCRPKQLEVKHNYHVHKIMDNMTPDQIITISSQNTADNWDHQITLAANVISERTMVKHTFTYQHSPSTHGVWKKDLTRSWHGCLGHEHLLNWDNLRPNKTPWRPRLKEIAMLSSSDGDRSPYKCLTIKRQTLIKTKLYNG